MAKRIVGNKKKFKRTSHLYFAVKSQNEIYYQMASIFKYVVKDKAFLTNKIFSRSIMEKSSNISLENSF